MYANRQPRARGETPRTRRARFLDAVETLALPRDHIHSSPNVTQRPRPCYGLSIRARRRARAIAKVLRLVRENVFLSTQYIPPSSSPLYAPSPALHEVLATPTKSPNGPPHGCTNSSGAAVTPRRNRRKRYASSRGVLGHLDSRRRRRRRPEDLRPAFSRRSASSTPSGKQRSARFDFREWTRRLRHHHVPPTCSLARSQSEVYDALRSVPHVIQRRDAFEVATTRS